MIIEKTYICPIIGSGTQEDPRRPRLADAPIEKSWYMIELGKFKEKEWALVSVVAEEADHDTLSLETDEVLFAFKRTLQIDATKLELLKSKFPKLFEKWETVKKCWVTLQEKTGKEE